VVNTDVVLKSQQLNVSLLTSHSWQRSSTVDLQSLHTNHLTVYIYTPTCTMITCTTHLPVLHNYL